MPITPAPTISAALARSGGAAAVDVHRDRRRLDQGAVLAAQRRRERQQLTRADRHALAEQAAVAADAEHREARAVVDAPGAAGRTAAAADARVDRDPVAGGDRGARRRALDHADALMAERQRVDRDRVVAADRREVARADPGAEDAHQGLARAGQRRLPLDAGEAPGRLQNHRLHRRSPRMPDAALAGAGAAGNPHAVVSMVADRCGAGSGTSRARYGSTGAELADGRGEVRC